MPTQRAFWDKAAEKYDRQTVKGPNYAARLDRAQQWIGPDASVLDAGCAGGHITLDLAPRVRHILGIDISPRLIDIAEQRRRDLGIDNAAFKATTLDDPALAEGAFDAVTAYSLLHLVEDVPATLARVHALLRPGGRFIAEVPTTAEINAPLRLLIRAMTLVGKAPNVKVYRQADYDRMFADAGFTIDEQKVYNPKSMNRSILATRRP